MRGIGQAINGPQLQEANPSMNVAQKFLAAAKLALYREEFIPKAVKMIQAGNPVAAVARIAASVGARIILKAKEQGEEIPGDVALIAGADFVQELGEFARTFAGVEMTQEQIEDAFLAASDNLRQALTRQGFQFSMARDPEAMGIVEQMSGGPEMVAQLQERGKNAQMSPTARRIGRRIGMRRRMKGEQ